MSEEYRSQPLEESKKQEGQDNEMKADTQRPEQEEHGQDAAAQNIAQEQQEQIAQPAEPAAPQEGQGEESSSPTTSQPAESLEDQTTVQTVAQADTGAVKDEAAVEQTPPATGSGGQQGQTAPTGQTPFSPGNSTGSNANQWGQQSRPAQTGWAYPYGGQTGNRAPQGYPYAGGTYQQVGQQVGQQAGQSTGQQTGRPSGYPYSTPTGQGAGQPTGQGYYHYAGSQLHQDTQPTQSQWPEYRQGGGQPPAGGGTGAAQAPGGKPPKKPMNKRTKIFLWIVGILVGGCVLGFSAYGVYSAANGGVPTAPSTSQSQSSSQTPESSSQEPATSSNNGVDPNGPTLEIHGRSENEASNATEIYENVKDSVVGVLTYETDAVAGEEPVSEGSGVVMSEDGYIITNSHVINDSSNHGVQVVFNDGEQAVATVVGYDTRTDIAVLKVDPEGLTLKPATFGDSSELQVGEWVLSLGNPGGLEFASTLTQGSISALDRTVTVNQNSMKYIQTDAAINPGSSGGALINMNGQVVGINAAKLNDTSIEGMCFAIPINTVQPVVNDLIQNGYVSGRVRLGMTGSVVSEYQSQALGVPKGILIRELSDDSDLNGKAQVGDIVTQINGIEVDSFNTLWTELGNYQPGDTVTLTIYRMATQGSNAQQFDIEVTLLEDRGETQQPVSSQQSFDPFG